jgi:uncharacterized membrane protein YraQ (UPF0718 family)
MIPADIQVVLWEVGGYVLDLALVLVPLFLLAAFLVGLAQAYLPPGRVRRLLERHDEGLGNVLAAGLGALTPFCSCSTVPMLAGLLQAGAPLGLSVSFLLASPLVNGVAVVLLAGLFGASATALYVAGTLGAAVLGGLLVGRAGLEDQVRELEPAGCAVDGDGPPTHRERLRAAARSAGSFLVDLLPYLALGLVAGGLLHGVVPQAWLEGLLGPANPLAVPLAALAGAPLYVSMSGMLPVAAALADQGIPLGTVLAFVVGGAGLSLPNLALLRGLFERRLLAVYAGLVLANGVAVGVAFNAL